MDNGTHSDLLASILLFKTQLQNHKNIELLNKE